MTFELPDKDKLCHHTAFEKKCRELVCSGTCNRWRSLPGADPFTGKERQAWGCVDDLVLFLQGEVVRQSDVTHSAMTQFREMVFNPEYRAKELSKQQDAKLIEAQTCKSPS